MLHACADLQSGQGRPWSGLLSSAGALWSTRSPSAIAMPCPTGKFFLVSNLEGSDFLNETEMVAMCHLRLPGLSSEWSFLHHTGNSDWASQHAVMLRSELPKPPQYGLTEKNTETTGLEEWLRQACCQRVRRGPQG